MGDDRDNHEYDDRPGRETRKQPDRQQETADEFQDADDPGPHQAVLEAHTFKKASRPLDVAEQDLIAVEGKRAARDQAYQRLGDRREDRIEAPERRDQQFR